MKKAALIFILFLSLEVRAQQDPQFSQYMFNTFYYNPAAAGTDGVTKITALYRSQWLGYSPTYGDGGPPITQILSVNTPVAKLKGGIGGYIVNDKLGPLTNQEIQFSYAHYIKIKNGNLSLGVRAGMYTQKLDYDLLRATDPADPLLAGKSGKESQSNPDFAAGAMYKTEKFYVGAGLNHLSEPIYSFGGKQASTLQQHIYVTGGYFYDLNFDIKIQFVTLIKSDFTKTQFDVGGIAYFKDVMWGGLSFRQSEAAVLILGYSLLKDKSLKVGYSLDYIVKDQQAKQPTSHELMLSYSLPVNLSGKKIIRTPRFRY